MLSHHQVLTYRSNRDRLRHEHGAPPPIWLDSHQSFGPAAWSRRSQPLHQRVQALRSLQDLCLHGENRAVATRSVDPQVSAYPICNRPWTLAHVLCECPSTSSARAAGSVDLTVALSRLPWALCWSWAAKSNVSSSYPSGPPTSGGSMGPGSHRCSPARDCSMLPPRKLQPPFAGGTSPY